MGGRNNPKIKIIAETSVKVDPTENHWKLFTLLVQSKQTVLIDQYCQHRSSSKKKEPEKKHIGFKLDGAKVI